MIDKLKPCVCACECMFQCCRDDKGIFKFVDESIAHDLVYADMTMLHLLCSALRV